DARVGQRVARRVHRDLRSGGRKPAGCANPVDPGSAPRTGRCAPGCGLCLAPVASELKSVYLIFGGDRPKIQRAIRRLRDRIGDDSTELLSGFDAGGADAVAACNSPVLFGSGQRLVVVTDVDRWEAADVKAGGAYPSPPPPRTALPPGAEALEHDSAPPDAWPPA